MNLTTEISPRPRLVPRYDRAADRAVSAPRSATLSGRELQQIVAEMLG